MKNILGNSEHKMSSREIAGLTGKRHDHVLRDCDKLNEHYKRMSLPTSGEAQNSMKLSIITKGDIRPDNVEEYNRSSRKQYKYLKPDILENIDEIFEKKRIQNFPLIKEEYYTHPNTGNQQHREMLLNKLQTMDLMTGYNVELRIKVNRRWEELENKNNQLDFSNPDTVLLLAQNWKNERDRANNLQLEIKEQEPMVIFAKALQVSNHSILVGELAKILKQNKIEIGQNRLFDWLRENSYLMSRGEQKNLPTQKSLELDLFEVKTTTIANPDGSVRVTKTTKIKPKGQEYFVNKFLKQKTFLA